MRVPGPPADHARARIDPQHVDQRHVRRIRDVVHLVEVHVVEARGVLQQVDHAHRVGRCHGLSMRLRARSPSTGASRSTIAVLVQLHERHRDERLADRSGAEVRVGGDRRPPIAIGQPTPPAHSTPVSRTSAMPAPGTPVSLSTRLAAVSELVEGLRARVGRRRAARLRGESGQTHVTTARRPRHALRTYRHRMRRMYHDPSWAHVRDRLSRARRARYRAEDPHPQQAVLPLQSLADLDLRVLHRARAADLRSVRARLRRPHADCGWPSC